MDRYWLLTWTTYGTHLPGDERGFVSPVSDGDGGHVVHNIPGTDYDSDDRVQRNLARAQMKHEPVRLTSDLASVLVEQFCDTANRRRWGLLASAIMADHVHVALGVPGDPDPSNLMRDFKAYGSGAMNKMSPRSSTWWTESGSKRKLPDEDAILSAVRYVMDQPYPLAIWTAPLPELGLKGGRLI